MEAWKDNVNHLYLISEHDQVTAKFVYFSIPIRTDLLAFDCFRVSSIGQG